MSVCASAHEDDDDADSADSGEEEPSRGEARDADAGGDAKSQPMRDGLLERHTADLDEVRAVECVRARESSVRG